MNPGAKRHLARTSASPLHLAVPHYTIRHARRTDVPDISSLEWEHKWVLDVYGFKKVVETLEHATLCAVAENATGDIQGYIVFNNYPDESLVSRHQWRPWLLDLSPLSEPDRIAAPTCLFMTQLICPEQSTNHIIGSFIRWIFASMPDLEYVFHATSCDYRLLRFLDDAGFRLVSKYGGRVPLLQAERAKFVPRLSSRPARLEDHDDLRGMFSRDEDKLKDRYGEYFLAEVIADKSESSLSMVMEVQKLAVGLMSVTTEIDYDLLNANFELAPFHGLRKPTRGDITGVKTKLSQEVFGIRPSSLQNVDEEAEGEKTPSEANAPSADGSGDAGTAESSGEVAKPESGSGRKSAVSFSADVEGGEENAKPGSKADVSKAASQADTAKRGSEMTDTKQEGASNGGGMEMEGGNAEDKSETSKSEAPKPDSMAEVAEVDRKADSSAAPNTDSKVGVAKAGSKTGPAIDPKTDSNAGVSKTDSKTGSATVPKTDSNAGVSKTGSKTGPATVPKTDSNAGVNKTDSKTGPATVPKTYSNAGVSKSDSKVGSSSTSKAGSKGSVGETSSTPSKTESKTPSSDSKINTTDTSQPEATSTNSQTNPASSTGDVTPAVTSSAVIRSDVPSVDSVPAAVTSSSEPRSLHVLEELWGRGALDAGFGQAVEEEAPIPDDEIPDGSRPVLEMIWGYPVAADGRVTRQVSGPVSGLSEAPLTGPTPVARAVPRYHGAPNAAAVTLFGVQDEYACRSLDLLPAVFAHLPDVDYIVLTTPADEPEMPLTELMTRVPHRACSTLPGELYVFHRASLITDLQVRPAQSKDLGDIRAMVKHMNHAEDLMTSVRELFMENVAQDTVFVVCCRDQLVGVVVVKLETNMEYIQSHFEIEENIAYDLHAERDGFGHLYHFAINPIFQRFSHIILAEVMRLTTLSVILHPLFPPGSEDPEGHSPTPALERMWPVAWRRQIQYPLDQDTLGMNIPKSVILQELEPMSLQLTTRRSVLRRRTRINSRIVVVGGGDAGLAVLETLVFSRELLFTNLTLVEPHGFQGDSECAEEVALVRTSTENFQRERLATMWLHAWVNLVRGEMRAINRKRKCIKIGEAGDEIPYDQLILTCGQQFQMPKRLVPRPPRPFQDRKPLFAPADLPLSPDNVFRVNSQFDAERALEYVRAYCMHRSENVVVYGGYLETLTCLATLIDLPMALHRLVLVLPPGHHGGKLNLTDDPQVDGGIFHNLRSVENGIRIMEGYELSYWDTKANNRIYRVHLTNQTDEGPRERYLSCCGLFVYDHKGVELATFKALNDASLVFDGRLCIDHNFCTNDASIRAVGTMTKYSRRYYADSFDHAEYNSRDVGHALASHILQHYGDTEHFQPAKLGTKDRRRSSISGQPLPPEFTLPLVVRARLPGGWQLLQVCAPKPILDLDPGAVLTTGDPVYPSETGYMRIEVSRYRVLQKITCYSQNQIETDNVIALYALHEVLLNNMVARYREGLIPDLYMYLRQPWTMMLFHDRFRTLLASIRYAMLSCRCRDGKLTLEEKIVDNLCRFSELSQEEHIRILEDFRTGGVDHMVETWILEYLANNQYHLPMYAREGTAQSLNISKDGNALNSTETFSGSRAHIT